MLVKVTPCSIIRNKKGIITGGGNSLGDPLHNDMIIVIKHISTVEHSVELPGCSFNWTKGLKKHHAKAYAILVSKYGKFATKEHSRKFVFTFNPESTYSGGTTSLELSTTSNMAATIVSAAYSKQCDVDISKQTSAARQLKESLTSVIMDQNNSTCVGCFETGFRQLQITFRVPGRGIQLAAILVGRNINC